MADDDSCKKCRQDMKLLREEIIAGTKYRILKCSKCRHQVARAEK